MTYPLLLVNFSVPPDVTPEFTMFKHKKFLPAILKHSPEIVNIIRYEEFGVGGTLRWYNKQYLTIYQFKNDAALAAHEEIFARNEVADVVNEFQRWRNERVFNFNSNVFKSTWTHRRQDKHEAFSGPFFLWQTEMKPEADEAFVKWYEEEYLPLQISEIPTWTGCRRYASVSEGPLRRLTFFETATEGTLRRSLEDLRAAHRVQENYEWQKRVESSVIWMDATSYRCIYRTPD